MSITVQVSGICVTCQDSFVYMGVSKNRGGFTPQIIHLFIGFGTIIFTIHFGGKIPLFLVQHPYYVCDYTPEN